MAHSFLHVYLSCYDVLPAAKYLVALCWPSINVSPTVSVCCHQAAVNITNTPLLDYLPILWKAISPKRDAFDETQMRDAVCNCTDTTNITLPLVGTYGFVNPTDYRTRIAKCTGEN